MLRFLVISAIIRIKKQKRDSCPVSTSLYRPEPVSLDLSSVQFSRARGKLIKYENYNSPRRISRESVLDVEARSRIHIQTPNFIYSIISLAFHFATSTSAHATMQTRLRDVNSFSFFCITIHPVLRVLSNDVIDAKKRKEKIRKKEKKEGEKRREKNRSRSNLFTRYTHTHTHTCVHVRTSSHGSLHDLSYGDNIFLPGRVGDRQEREKGGGE